MVMHWTGSFASKKINKKAKNLCLAQRFFCLENVHNLHGVLTRITKYKEYNNIIKDIAFYRLNIEKVVMKWN